VVSEGPLRLAAVLPVATPTPLAPLPAESLESETAAGWPPPAATTMNLYRHLVGPADNRAILATAKERVNQAECVVARQTGRVEALRLILTPCWTRRRLRKLPRRQVLAKPSRRPAVQLAPSPEA
jgi:hypothetical protein